MLRILDTDIELLRRLYQYKDGNLYKDGSILGHNRLGAWIIHHKGCQYQAHRLIYAYHYGIIPEGMQIDHVDGNRCNNNIQNLRLASASENMWNTGVISTNTSGYKGVWQTNGKWWCKLQKAGIIYKECFGTLEDAIKWIENKRLELHGEYSRNKWDNQ